MSKVICMGECLIDFLPIGDNQQFQAKAGGAPANVCASVAKLGGDAYYLGKMSTDNFGKFLLLKLQECKVKTNYIVKTSEYSTALAFVTLTADGDRSFAFYRNPSADMMLDKSEISNDIFCKGDILHFCSVGLTESPAKYAHIQAIEYATQNGALISFDVNVRLPLWSNIEDCKSAIIEFLPTADILKVTDEELQFITGVKNEGQAVKTLMSMANKAKLVFVTKGKNGVTVYDRSLDCFDRSAVDVKVVDTTGAGDCFSGAILYNIMNGCEINLASIRSAVNFASYACAVVIGRKGAMQSMPDYHAVIALQNEVE